MFQLRRAVEPSGSGNLLRGGSEVAFGALLCWSCASAAAAELDIDIKDMTIEQLIETSVTTVSRSEQKWQASAAAVYVLSREDIRRAHATSVPDALRLVPGVQVARIDANKWAVSIRGFNGRTANKLLVLVDGRSIYDPLFAGTFWESRDVVLEEIERIEVVRGPGGTLWGANAVNGVINIITRHSADTQGTRVTAGAGTELQLKTGARHGWQPGPNSHARVYVDRVARDAGWTPGPDHDDSQLLRAGFRADWHADNGDQMVFRGNAYTGTFGTHLAAGGFQDLDHRGANLLTRWIRRHEDDSRTMVQFWYDNLSFDDVNLEEDRHTYDLEFQHSLTAMERHLVVFGGGYRHTTDDTRDGPVFALRPRSRSDNLYNLFIQDEIGFADDAVKLTLGTKVEHNDYSGTEWQPNVRLAWLPDERNTWWGAVSRAVRSPSRLETDIFVPASPFRSEFDSEKLTAYEAGYRSLIRQGMWLDIAVFHNVYDDLLSVEGGTVITNRLRGETNGVEVATHWQYHPALTLDIAYTWLNLDIETAPGGTDAARAAQTEDREPRHQLVIRGTWSPRETVGVDAVLRYVDELPALDVPSYAVADIGVRWALTGDLRLSAVAHDLFDSHHPEQGGATATEVERGLYLQLDWNLR